MGDSIEIQWDYQHGVAGTAGTGSYAFSLPPGIVVDTAKLNESGNFSRNTIGSASAYIDGTSGSGQMRVFGVNGFTAEIHAESGGASTHTLLGGSWFPLSGTDVRYSMSGKFPVVGWGAGAVLSGNELSLQTIKARYTSGTTTGITTTAQTITQDVKEFDTHNAYNSTTGVFTAPRKGTVRVNHSYLTTNVSTNNANSGVGCFVRKNGTTNVASIANFRMGEVSASVAPLIQGSCELEVEKGDTLEITMFRSNNLSNDVDLNGNGQYNFTEFIMQPDLTVIGAASDQNYFESEEQDLGTISWNNTPPGGTPVKKYKWFQRGKIVDFFFWYDYGGSFASNTFSFFDLPPDLPIPSIQVGSSLQTSHAGSAHVGNGGSIGSPATCHYLNSNGRVYVSHGSAINSNEVHGHLRYYID